MSVRASDGISSSSTFYQKTITKINDLDKHVKFQKMPVIIQCAQEILDTAQSCIADLFEAFFDRATCGKMKDFNAWLKDYAKDKPWYKELVDFLVKLPLRVARNIVKTFCQLIQTLLYTAIHPLEAMVSVLRFLTDFIHSLRLEETWINMGASLMGAMVGAALIPGNPFSILGFAIGAAFVLGGISCKVIRNYKNLGKLRQSFKQIPEFFLTSMVLGTITGALRRYQIERSIRKMANEFECEVIKMKVDYNNIDLLLEQRYSFYNDVDIISLKIESDCLWFNGHAIGCPDAMKVFSEAFNHYNSAPLTAAINGSRVISIIGSQGFFPPKSA